MPPLFNTDSQEKTLAGKVIWFQIIITLVASGAANSWESSQQYAIPILGGGGVSVLIGVLLAWRMNRRFPHPANDARQQLTQMYFYAAERFLAVIALLGICLIVLKLSPLAVVIGFVLGQIALVMGWLFIEK